MKLKTISAKTARCNTEKFRKKKSKETNINTKEIQRIFDCIEHASTFGREHVIVRLEDSDTNYLDYMKYLDYIKGLLNKLGFSYYLGLTENKQSYIDITW